jgi:hypothetical protein
LNDVFLSRVVLGSDEIVSFSVPNLISLPYDNTTTEIVRIFFTYEISSVLYSGKNVALIILLSCI